MPFHLELGSDGHSFNGKAIVVNSITGRHLSHNPIPMEKAKAQKRVVEQAVAEHGEHVTASGKPDGRKKVKAPAPPSKRPPMRHPMDKAERIPMSASEAKKLAQQAKEAITEARRQKDELEMQRMISKMAKPVAKAQMMEEKIHHADDTTILPIKAKVVPKSDDKVLAFKSKYGSTLPTNRKKAIVIKKDELETALRIAGFSEKKAKEGAERYRYSGTYGFRIHKAPKSVIISEEKSDFEKEMDMLERQMGEEIKASLGV
jgi:hypothetical protein